MWAGPTQKKEKIKHYMLCLSYPQALKPQISYLHYPIITYNYSIALLVTTAIKTQVITGLAPEKASRIRAVWWN